MCCMNCLFSTLSKPWWKVALCPKPLFCLKRLHTEPAVCLLLSFLFSLCFHKPWVLKELFGILSSVLLWWKSKVKKKNHNKIATTLKQCNSQNRESFRGIGSMWMSEVLLSLRATSLPPYFHMLHGQWHHCKVKKNISVFKTIFD